MAFWPLELLSRATTVNGRENCSSNTHYRRQTAAVCPALVFSRNRLTCCAIWYCLCICCCCCCWNICSCCRCCMAYCWCCLILFMSYSLCAGRGTAASERVCVQRRREKQAVVLFCWLACPHRIPFDSLGGALGGRSQAHKHEMYTRGVIVVVKKESGNGSSQCSIFNRNGSRTRFAETLRGHTKKACPSAAESNGRGPILVLQGRALNTAADQ